MRRRETVGDGLLVAGALALFVSLFLPWSHQLSPAFLVRARGNPVLQGIPADPTAWQVYSAADVALAMLAGALLVVALTGAALSLRIGSVAGVALAIAFTIHALAKPPTNRAGGLLALGYAPGSASAGAGETVALVGLAAGAVGLLLSFTPD